jgi:sensor histidine kinase YesM
MGLLYTGMISVLLYYYFCRLAGIKFQWYYSVMYAVLSCSLAIFRHLGWTTEFLDMCLGIMLLTGCGMLFQKIRFTESIGLSSLIISLYSIVAGMMQSAFFWIVASIRSEIVLKFADLLQNAAVVAMLILTCRIIHKSFSGSMRPIRHQSLLMLLFPVLFITFFEAFISDFVYGNTIIWDTEKGLTFPSLNNFELLVLRLLACGGLFCALIAYRKLSDLIEHEQTIRLLRQQTQNQEVYVREAKSRYEQTRSFRHDIKNHLLILHQLIKDGKSNEASEYLGNMETVSDALSFQVHTGNAAADALLSSKLGVASQQEIHVHCAISIPKQSLIADMDWCIVLSNALDNAINASAAIDRQDRWIHLSGIQKGNIYLLSIENRCRKDTALPLEGIGFSNIRAVLKKYNGNMDVEVAENIFKLNMLFIIPQHPKDIPQQSH